MDPEVIIGRPALLSIESGEACSNAGERLHVNPIVPVGGALQGPKHGERRSNARAGAPRCAQWVLLHALKRAGQLAAVAGEG